MSTYREPIVIFGVVFKTYEDAVAFCNDRYATAELNFTELGLEYFENTDEYILGWQINPGESDGDRSFAWHRLFGSFAQNPKSMLRIRVY
jgi:hypothetical protein